MLSQPSYRLLVCAMFTTTVAALACSSSVTGPNVPDVSASTSTSASRDAERQRRAADSAREDSARGRENEPGEDSADVERRQPNQTSARYTVKGAHSINYE